MWKIKTGCEPQEFVPEGDFALGGDGRGENLVIIPIIGDPAQGYALRAGKTAQDQLVLGWAPVSPVSDGRTLAVVDAMGAYDRSRSYRIHEATNIQILAEGWCSWGAAGRINGGTVSLVQALPGGEFCLNSKFSCLWYRWDGSSWATETVAQRRARLALAAVQAGDVSWL